MGDPGEVDVAGVGAAQIIDAAFRRASVGMAITDAAGYYLEVNAALCSFVGYSATELLGMSFRDLNSLPDLADGVAAMVDLEEGRASEFSLDLRYRTSAGRDAWARTTGIAVREIGRAHV